MPPGVEGQTVGGRQRRTEIPLGALPPGGQYAAQLTPVVDDSRFVGEQNRHCSQRPVAGDASLQVAVHTRAVQRAACGVVIARASADDGARPRRRTGDA